MSAFGKMPSLFNREYLNEVHVVDVPKVDELVLASEQSQPKTFISPFESVVASLSSNVQQQQPLTTVAAQTLVNAPEPVPVVTE